MPHLHECDRHVVARYQGLFTLQNSLDLLFACMQVSSLGRPKTTGHALQDNITAGLHVYGTMKAVPKAASVDIARAVHAGARQGVLHDINGTAEHAQLARVSVAVNEMQVRGKGVRT